MILIKVNQYYISVSHETLKHLNSCELTGPMKYKERYIRALQDHGEDGLVQTTHVSLVVFSHFVVAFRFLHPNPAKEEESGQKMIIHAVWCPKKGAYHPLSNLQLLSVINFLAEKLFVSNKYFLSSNAFYIYCLYCFIFPLSRLTQSSCILFLPLLQWFRLP